jgi:hypothetical protein
MGGTGTGMTETAAISASWVRFCVVSISVAWRAATCPISCPMTEASWSSVSHSSMSAELM